MYPEPIKNLIRHFSKIPGVGEKTALKYIFELIKWDDLDNFSGAILELKNNIGHCEICGNLAQDKICNICKDGKRDKSTICVVAKIQEVFSIEAIGDYKGIYHVLHYYLSPLDGITPDKLNLQSLIYRIKNNNISEIILALNPDINGESTALYITNLLKKYNIAISRIAKGLPMGSSIEYADQTTISNALKGRIKLI